MLRGTGLRKSFGGSEVLRGVDVEVSPGQITAIIGPSGAGKSTLIRLLALLDRPEAGQVEVDGTIHQVPLRSRNGSTAPWPNVTVVFQQLFLWPHLTLRQNVEMPLRLRGVSLDPGFVEGLLNAFELEVICDRHPNQVSLGQRQRAALVRALALRPRYLLLDEITSALDVEHVGKVLDQLTRLRATGAGVLLVTHLVGFAKRAADTVLFLEDGRVVEQGTPLMLANPRTERLAKFLSLVETAR